MTRNELHPPNYDKHGMMRLIKKQYPDLNSVESKVLLSNPFLLRIPSAVKPTALTVEIPINHNPDYLLYHTWVEVKGGRFTREWLKLCSLLKHKHRYKVIIACDDKRRRNQMTRSLTKSGVEYALIDDPTTPWVGRWFAEAKQDWDNSTCEEREATAQLVKRLTNETPLWLRQ